MLLNKNRLKQKKDFIEIFKKGKGFEEDLLFLKIKLNNSKKNRFAFVVSKKVSNKAVIRNKIKRILREIIRKKILKIKPGIDGILIVKPGIEKKDFLEIEKMVENLLKKANTLND
jgi:ribonuclease P protein component